MQLVLDIGSGRSLPDADTAIKLIDEVAKRDTKKHEVILKTQLFESAPPNVPLDHSVFSDAFWYAKEKGYQLTSSVFDLYSLRYLLLFDDEKHRLPFIKIACRPELYWLIGEIPRRIPVYVSTNDYTQYLDSKGDNVTWMMCVPEYPATLTQYSVYSRYPPEVVSDHTVGWGLLTEFEPEIIEKHVCLEHTPDNPDAGAFAVLPEELEEIL